MKRFLLGFLSCVSFIFFNCVRSDNVTFRNISLSTSFELLTTIESGKNLGDFLVDKKLETVIVSGAIPILFEDSVSGIQNVEELLFLKNGIEEIRPGAFTNSTFLGLGITHSKLKTINHNVFVNIPLRELQVRFNPIKTITKNTFALPELSFLGLQNNEIDSFEENSLDGVPNLEVLDLGNNKIKTLPSLFFKSLSSLKTVILRNNELQDFSEEVFDSNSIEHLDLTNNSILKMPEHCFNQLPKMNRIVLTKNRLTHISKNIFTGNKVLQQIELNNNQISSIHPEAFDNMPNLANVLLSSNKISQYDIRWFKNTPNIYRLFFSYNLIEDLPDEALKNIYNKKKQWIKFDSNKIKKISPNTFKGFKRINNLNLAHNEIQIWNDTFLEDAEVVDFVNLLYNKIRCPEGHFQKIFKANVTYVLGNPISDECLQKIQKWNKENPGKRVCVDSVICSD